MSLRFYGLPVKYRQLATGEMAKVPDFPSPTTLSEDKNPALSGILGPTILVKTPEGLVCIEDDSNPLEMDSDESPIENNTEADQAIQEGLLPARRMR